MRVLQSCARMCSAESNGYAPLANRKTRADTAREDWKAVKAFHQPGVLLGCDFAGRCVESDSSKSHISVGDRVAGASEEQDSLLTGLMAARQAVLWATGIMPLEAPLPSISRQSKCLCSSLYRADSSAVVRSLYGKYQTAQRSTKQRA